ncbi:cytochrome-c peroxidase [Robertkochia solimangrovi]|uniref:cytochrome-c peroxidase n=1 Tax=Robertkochia solimangrovi TaxID=2213046 RepID=UPI001180ED57|nr:cytochrome c peroxidase [Robertkochia solimangrovi]TRZ43199.1 cytochrome-c peroxidase [Robertkochia solimangrovi]
MKQLIPLIIFSMLVACKNETSMSEDYLPVTELRKMYGSGDASKWPEAVLDSSIDRSEFKDIGVLPEVTHPETNPFNEDKAYLGKMLFHDPRLSQSGQIACASCHNPELAWTDNITRSFGHDRQNGKRNAMTIMNSAFAKELFWDGRAESLEDQARFPIADKVEMNEELTLAVEKIQNTEGYKPYFQKAFGNDSIDLDRIKKAIATFERTIISYQSKFDRFISGDSALFTDQEIQGLHIYRTKANCISCHNTPYFSDNKFHNDGQTLFGTKNEDFGRYHVTGNQEDIGKFRTPTLREVGRTGPWMHNGHFPSLIDVIEFYNLGNPSPIQKKYLGTPRDSLIPDTSPILRKLDLNRDEINALEAFLKTLSTPVRRIIIPELPE